MNDQTPETTSGFNPLLALGVAAAVALTAVAAKKASNRVNRWRALRKADAIVDPTE